MTSDIEALEATLQSDPNADEGDLFLLLSASSIAKLSIVYWSENADKWGTLLNDCPFIPEVAAGIGKENAGKIGAADVAGGVVATVRVGIVALFGSVGTVTAVGGIIGSAIGASAGAAVICALW